MPSPVLSIGLRTVTGIYNNLLPGQENFGTAGQPFPRLTTPSYREGEPFDPDGPGPLPATLTSYLPIGTVVDSSVRVISNLIADNSSHNPAAVEASGFNLALGADGIADTADDNQHVDDVFIANTAPDLGLSAPFNGWMTLFGQFFDHGLDLVAKGDAGTVFIPLMPDDPLYVPGSQTNVMVLTRATRAPGEDGVLGTADDTTMNKTSPFVDQNQTYTSHPSHQVLLREYAMVDGKPVATGALLDGAAGGLASWGDIKAQARDKLGIDLTDADVANLPLLATDEYGRFLRGPGGFVQVVMQDGTLQEGDPANPISLTGAVRAGVAALDDIAHAAVPFGDHDGDRATPNQLLTADADNTAGNTPGLGFYDDELLDAHFSTGDGRGNENIGLTAVHTIFHSEHNRMVDQIKDVVLATGDAAFIAEWLVAGANAADGVSAAEWSGERLFQAAKFSTEMQYQHLVFEEFARKITPQTDIFVAYDVTMNPAIVGEFAHTV